MKTVRKETTKYKFGGNNTKCLQPTFTYFCNIGKICTRVRKEEMGEENKGEKDANVVQDDC